VCRSGSGPVRRGHIVQRLAQENWSIAMEIQMRHHLMTAMCDASTAPPVLNVSDFVCFLNAYAAACP